MSRVKIWYGRRLTDGEPIVEREDGRRPGMCWNECRHSPDGPEWGYGGSGPAQLAYALLRHSGDAPTQAWGWHQGFKEQVIARLPRERWAMSAAWIARGGHCRPAWSELPRLFVVGEVEESLANRISSLLTSDYVTLAGLVLDPACRLTVLVDWLADRDWSWGDIVGLCAAAPGAAWGEDEVVL